MPLDVNDGTDLAALHSVIATELAAAFPGVHCEFYREDRVNLPMGDGQGENPPRAYVLMEMSELEVGDTTDPGTEQQEMMARFEAEVIVKGIRTSAKVDVRVLAGALAAYLRQRGRWPGVIASPPMVVGCYKDDFSPELDKYEVWRVEWLHEVRLGQSAWLGGVRPTQVLWSYSPLIGASFEDQYTDALGQLNGG